MPDAWLLGKAVAAAAAVASIVQLVAWWLPAAMRRRAIRADGDGTPEQPTPTRPGAARTAVGGALGASAGFLAGAWALDQRPNWPIAEDRDRFLLVLVPVVVIVECIAAVPRVPAWLAWGMRVLLSAASAPILLYGSTYLAELPGAPRAWTNWELAAWLTGLAIALAAVWMGAARLLRTNPGRLLPFALATSAGAAGVTIMLSGYLTGGELALPLAGAVGGASLAALGLRMLRCDTGAVGVGVVGLFAVLVMGRFFGNMTTVHGAILLAAPLLVCASELLPRKVSSSWLRGALAAVIVVIPIVFVVAQARAKFAQESSNASPDDTTADEYLEYK